ncbi:MAG: 1,4-dihydroxy-2-naphthoyl-CoA hydrolase [Clostridia bacterium]|nr:1,4-dihydroxy-2-naphthoyl-CoA hydrolase [Clostridia bacterium]
MDYKGTILETLNIKNIELSPNRVVLSMPVGPKTRQPMGYLHGGASVVLAESAASIGTLLNIDNKSETAVGIEINANHIRSISKGLVIAVATPLHKGKKTMVWDIKITDEQNNLICVSRCTIGIVKL